MNHTKNTTTKSKVKQNLKILFKQREFNLNGFQRNLLKSLLVRKIIEK